MVGTSQQRLSILIADPDEGSRARLAALLDAAGYAVLEASRGDQALAMAASGAPAAGLLEIPLEGLCGYELCRALKSQRGPAVPVVFVSRTRTEPYDRIAGLLLQADDY